MKRGNRLGFVLHPGYPLHVQGDSGHSCGKADRHRSRQGGDLAYTLMNLFCSYTIRTDPTDIQLYAKGTNLTNELIRVHTSFLCNSAPLPGASLEVGVSVGF